MEMTVRVITTLVVLVLVLASPAASADDQAVIDSTLASAYPGATGKLFDSTLRVSPPDGLPSAEGNWRAHVAGGVIATRVASVHAVEFATADGTLLGSESPVGGAGPPNIDSITEDAARQQAADNLEVLRNGLPAGSVLDATTTLLDLDTDKFAVLITVRVQDLLALRDHWGDLGLGLTTGFGLGADARTEGIAVEVADAAGHSLGGWSMPREGSGEVNYGPGATSWQVTLPFVSETGSPVPTGAQSAGPAPGAQASLTVRQSAAWSLPRKQRRRIARTSRKVRIELHPPQCGALARVRIARTKHAVVITTVYNVVEGDGYSIPSCPAPQRRVVTVKLRGRLGRRSLEDGSATPPAVRLPSRPRARARARAYGF